MWHCVVMGQPFTKQQILGQSKLPAFVNDKIDVTHKSECYCGRVSVCY